jgi:hypothetical protein
MRSSRPAALPSAGPGADAEPSRRHSLALPFLIGRRQFPRQLMALFPIRLGRPACPLARTLIGAMPRRMPLLTVAWLAHCSSPSIACGIRAAARRSGSSACVSKESAPQPRESRRIARPNQEHVVVRHLLRGEAVSRIGQLLSKSVRRLLQPSALGQEALHDGAGVAINKGQSILEHSAEQSNRRRGNARQSDSVYFAATVPPACRRARKRVAEPLLIRHPSTLECFS